MNVGTGASSVTRMGALADAIAQRLPHAGDLRQLARMVGHNAERDLHRWSRRQPWRALLPEPYKFSMEKLGHGAQATLAVERDHWALLPHELWAAVDTTPELFRFLFVGENLEAWWRAAEAAGASWLADHPVVAAVPAGLRVPLGMHGDDARVHGGESILVVTWGSTAVEAPTLDTRLVFSMLKKSECVKGVSERRLFEVLAWSFAALAAGEFPACDEQGRPFDGGHHPLRARLAGRPLTAAGWRGCFSELRGDWKFLREALKLEQHYGRNALCHLCSACKRTPPLYTDFRRTAAHRGTLVDNREWLAVALAKPDPSPLVSVPGFSIWQAQFDIMHTVDLGILQVAVPSALAELTAPGGRFAGESLQERLDAATRHYRAWCREHRIPSVAKPFTRAWVDGPFPHITQLQAKAAVLRAMAYWVREVCVEAAEGPHGRLRAACFEALTRADVVCRRASRHLQADERASLAQAVEHVLVTYNALAVEATAAGVARWRVLPKHHALSHIGYDNAGVNPRSISCYPDEDMVGRMKRIYTRCHGLTAPTRGLARYIILAGLRWQHQLLHLRGVRPMPIAAGAGAASGAVAVAAPPAPVTAGAGGPAPATGGAGGPAPVTAGAGGPAPATAGAGGPAPVTAGAGGSAPASSGLGGAAGGGPVAAAEEAPPAKRARGS